jgi:hypothetical protein
MASSKRPSIEELAEFDEQTLQNFAKLDRSEQRDMIRLYESAKGDRLWTAEGRRHAALRAKTLRSLYRKLHRKDR